MNLDIAARANLADRILSHLAEAAPESEALLRGSLAEARADRYSDIDVLWEIPDACFQSCVDNIPAILSRVQPIDSVRSDPDFQNSRKRRRLFIRFEAVPLFWQLNLEVFAKSIQKDQSYDVNNPDARGSEGPPLSESVLANVVATVKAHLRRDDAEALSLLLRAYQCVGLPVPEYELKWLILRLINSVRIIDPKTSFLARKVENLVVEVF
jgi:hypothetical protein